MPRPLRPVAVRRFRPAAPRAALLVLTLAAAAGCASLRGSPGEAPASAAADPCQDARYLELKEKGPRGLSREDSLFVVRTSVACTYGARPAGERGEVMVGRAPVDTVRVEAPPAPPPARGADATAWTVTGLMLWVLAHAAGVL